MLRELMTLVVPLLLPTLLYLVWVRAVRWSEAGAAGPPQPVPWVWLAASGLVLAALVLFVVTVHFGTSENGVYIPPHVEDGGIVPGRIEPGPTGPGNRP